MLKVSSYGHVYCVLRKYVKRVSEKKRPEIVLLNRSPVVTERYAWRLLPRRQAAEFFDEESTSILTQKRIIPFSYE